MVHRAHPLSLKTFLALSSMALKVPEPAEKTKISRSIGRFDPGTGAVGSEFAGEGVIGAIEDPLELDGTRVSSWTQVPVGFLCLRSRALLGSVPIVLGGAEAPFDSCLSIRKRAVAGH